MKPEAQSLTPEQSLDIISKMIAQAQGKMHRSSFHFLLWGWVITAANFSMYYMLAFSNYPKYAPFVWLITIPAWIITLLYSRKQGMQATSHTHLDRVNMWLWMGTGFIILPIIIFGYKINFQINPLILTFVALPTFVTGIMIRFKPLLFGGVCFLVGGIICFLMSPAEQYLVGGATIICGYLIPGYLLKKQKG